MEGIGYPPPGTVLKKEFIAAVLDFIREFELFFCNTGEAFFTMGNHLRVDIPKYALKAAVIGDYSGHFIFL